MRLFLRLLLACFVAWHTAGVAPLAAQEARTPTEADLVQGQRVEGLELYDDQIVLEAMGQTVGRPFDPLASSRGVRALWGDYKIHLRVVREPAPGGIVLVYKAYEVPVDHEPRFVGNDRIKTSRLLEWADLVGRAELYLSESKRVRQRLIEGYRTQGYYFAEVDVVTSGEGKDGEPLDVIFEIREGPKVRCVKVTVNGNESMPERGWAFWRSGLRHSAQVETKGRGLLRWFGKPFVRQTLDADLVAMRQVYRDLGWLDAIVEVKELEFNEDRSKVVVHLVVDEGERYTIADLSIQAVERALGDSPSGSADEDGFRSVDLYFTQQELLAECELGPGKPFDRSLLAADERALGSFYGERGYIARRRFANASNVVGWEFLEPVVVADVENKEVLVTYRMVQGRRRTLREVRFAGNPHTRDKVLRREISALPGEVANVREIDRSLARLRNTGFFRDDRNPYHLFEHYVFLETDDPEQVDVEFRVEEGRVVDLQLSGGVASDSGLIGLISLSMRNFDLANPPSSPWSLFRDVYRKEALHGAGEVFQVDLSPGSQVSFFRARYRLPDIFDTHFDRTSFEVEALRRERRFRSHDEDRLRFDIQMGRLFGHDFSVAVGPSYQRLEISDLDPDPASTPRTLEASEGKQDFHGIDFAMRLDRRDDRLAPRDGYYASWRNTFYGGFLGGDNDLVRSELILDFYDSIGDEQRDVRPGWYVGLGAGIAHSYDGNRPAHYSERFFYGGSVTLRGFQFRGVGPNDGDFALGGETGLRGTLEWRYPLYSVPVPGTSRKREFLRGFLFSDFGILDENSFELARDQLRATWGFGFGLIQPIPLTFNFGFPLRKGEGDVTEVFSFSLRFR